VPDGVQCPYRCLSRAPLSRSAGGHLPIVHRVWPPAAGWNPKPVPDGASADLAALVQAGVLAAKRAALVFGAARSRPQQR